MSVTGPTRSSEAKRQYDEMVKEQLTENVMNAASGAQEDDDGSSTQGGGTKKTKGGKPGKPHIHAPKASHTSDAGGAGKTGDKTPTQGAKDGFDAQQSGASSPVERGGHTDPLGNEAQPAGHNDEHHGLQEHYDDIDSLVASPPPAAEGKGRAASTKDGQKTSSQTTDKGSSSAPTTGNTSSPSTTSKSVTQATTQLQQDLASGSDAKVGQDLKNFKSTMEAAGRGSEVGKAVANMVDQANLPSSRQQKISQLAKNAGIEVSGSTTDSKSNLENVLSSSDSTKQDVDDATDKYINDARSSGKSDDEINQELNTIAGKPGSISNLSAEALVQAVKNGLDPTKSSSDDEQGVKAKSAVEKKVREEQKARQEAAQQAAQSSDGGGGDAGGTSGAGDSGGSGDSGSADDVSANSGEGKAANNLTAQDAMSMDQLAAKCPPKLKAIIPQLEAAAKQYNIQPQLLVAIAMTESTGGSDASAYSNGGGMFQFTDPNTWKQYGNGSRLDDVACCQASAKYMADLINNHGGDLNAALREYNGPIGQGGNPNYQSTIYSFMAGKNF